MIKICWSLLLGLAMVCGGCATSQLIDITSEPSKAAVSINDEFIGKTPVVYDIEDVDDFKSLRVVIEKSGFESEMKRIRKKSSSKLFPAQVHFVLDPAYTAGEQKKAHTNQQQMGGQQMQGPTIVIPGVAPAPAPVLQKSQQKSSQNKTEPVEKTD